MVYFLSTLGIRNLFKTGQPRWPPATTYNPGRNAPGPRSPANPGEGADTDGAQSGGPPAGANPGSGSG